MSVTSCNSRFTNRRSKYSLRQRNELRNNSTVLSQSSNLKCLFCFCKGFQSSKDNVNTTFYESPPAMCQCNHHHDSHTNDEFNELQEIIEETEAKLKEDKNLVRAARLRMKDNKKRLQRLLTITQVVRSLHQDHTKIN
jgi:Zn-finger protein